MSQLRVAHDEIPDASGLEPNKIASAESSHKVKDSKSKSDLLNRLQPPRRDSFLDQRSLLLQSDVEPSETSEYSYGPEISSTGVGGELDLQSLAQQKGKEQDLSLLPEPIIGVNVAEESRNESTEKLTASNGLQDLQSSTSSKDSFTVSYSALSRMNALNERTTDRIVSYVENQLQQLQEIHQQEVNAVMMEHENTLSIARKRTREIKTCTDKNTFLSEQLTSLHSENVRLRERISELEEMILRGPENAAVASILKDIKERLWGDTLKIGPEKRKRIVLLKKLSQTRFKPTNEKHRALLTRLWLLHSPNKPEPVWTELGFETNSPGDELGSTGILGLQNLVYFSERYSDLAKERSRTELYPWARAGISITALLTSLLHLHGDKGFFSAFAPSGIFKTFTNLMNHSKAFEELYCVCFMIYDNVIKTEPNENALAITKRKLQDLLHTNPQDLQELIQNAKYM